MNSLVTQSAKHALRDRKDDLYESPEVAVEALLKVETLPPFIWEPACGPGAIVRVLRRSGFVVRATDLVNYGCPDSEARIDFLAEYQTRVDVQAIVTNPPYKLALEFVEHALKMSPLVIMLLRLAFIEGMRRSIILDSGHLARIHVFRNRLPMMHRNGWDGPKAGSAIPYAWFVWDRWHVGAAEVRRISWEHSDHTRPIEPESEAADPGPLFAAFDAESKELR